MFLDVKPGNNETITTGKKEELGIAGFGVSVTTMEEVFLKVKDESDEDIKSRLHRRGTLRPGSKRQPVEPVEHTPPPAPGPHTLPMYNMLYLCLVQHFVDLNSPFPLLSMNAYASSS